MGKGTSTATAKAPLAKRILAKAGVMRLYTPYELPPQRESSSFTSFATMRDLPRTNLERAVDPRVILKSTKKMRRLVPQFTEGRRVGGKGARYKGMLSGILKPISLGYAEQQRDGLKAYKGFLERRRFVVWSIYCDA